MPYHIGTSGFSYKEWKGSFYPEDLPAKQMLGYYAERLSAVEINNTFYRMPKRELLAGWSEQVPESFTFVLKAPRRITHTKKLRDAGDDVAYLCDAAAELGPRLGPILFQLPPYLKRDVSLLDDFLAEIPDGVRAALEFRSSSWLEDEVYETLRRHGAALVAADTGEESNAPLVATAPFGYARLRRVEYDAGSLRAWAERLRAEEWEDTYVFFKHEDAATGPRLAAEFAELIR
jgi:uncharacterized protein YecE (DUF72 family)